jgi:hypothetical protein
MNPRISEVIPMQDYKLKLVFTNGERGIYDKEQLSVDRRSVKKPSKKK